MAPTAFEAILFFGILFRAKWQDIANAAAERIKKEEQDIAYN